MLKDLFKKKSAPMLGLDIGTSFVKAVLIEPSGDGYCVRDFACEPVKGDAFADRAIKDFDAVSKALQKIKKGIKHKTKDVVVAVSGASVITKVVYMDPEQTDVELEGQIELEADSLIPYPLEEVYLDFEELGPSINYNNKVDVLLSAAHRDIVDGRVTLIREVEYNPRIVDVEGYALGNAMLHFAQSNEEHPLCCFNLGANQLLLTVIHQGKIIYSKEHSFGLNQLIQDLAVIYSLDKDEAIRQLVSGELDESWKQGSYPGFLANLQQQISRSLQMFVSTTSAEQPQQLLICGGGASIPGLVEDLDRELGIEVQLFNPFSDMQILHPDAEGLNTLAPQMVLAAGLASRSFNPCHL